MPNITTAELMVVSSLARELATEIDLHYELEDKSAVASTIKILIDGQKLLKSKHIDVPDAVTHVIGKFSSLNN